MPKDRHFCYNNACRLPLTSSEGTWQEICGSREHFCSTKCYRKCLKERADKIAKRNAEVAKQSKLCLWGKLSSGTDMPSSWGSGAD